MTGAFNIRDAGTSNEREPPSDRQEQEQMAQQEREYAAQMAELRAQYGHLPESVRATMGIGGT